MFYEDEHDRLFDKYDSLETKYEKLEKDYNKMVKKLSSAKWQIEILKNKIKSYDSLEFPNNSCNNKDSDFWKWIKGE